MKTLTLAHALNDFHSEILYALEHDKEAIVRIDGTTYAKPSRSKRREVVELMKSRKFGTLEIVSDAVTWSFYQESDSGYRRVTDLADGLEPGSADNWDESLYNVLAAKRYDFTKLCQDYPDLMQEVNSIGSTAYEIFMQAMAEEPFQDEWTVMVKSDIPYRGSQGQAQDAISAREPSLDQVVLARLTTERMSIRVTSPHEYEFRFTAKDKELLKDSTHYVNVRDAHSRWERGNHAMRGQPSRFSL